MSEFIVDFLAAVDACDPGPDRVMIRRASFLVRDGAPCIFWDEPISADLEDVLIKFGFVVDRYRSPDYDQTMAGYAGGRDGNKLS